MRASSTAASGYLTVFRMLVCLASGREPGRASAPQAIAHVTTLADEVSVVIDVPPFAAARIRPGHCD
jgi:hypothetical protein